MSNVLQCNAVLHQTTVKLGGLLGERRDKGASETVSNTYSASSKQVKAAKYLINRQHKKVKAVQAHAQRIRDLVYKYSFPWGDSNLRLLPIKAHKEFTDKLEIAIREFWDSVDEYVAYYPYLVEDSKQNLTGLGLLFDPAQYPPQEKIKGYFSVSVEQWPIPASEHFVAGLVEDAAEQAKATITKLVVERQNQAVNDMLHRVEEGVAEYIDKVSAYKKGEKRIEKTFRDSLNRNILEVSRLVKTLNLWGDAGLDNLAEQVSRLARVTCESLRNDPQLRQDMVSEGKSLIARLDGYRKTDSVVDQMIGSVNEYMQ